MSIHRAACTHLTGSFDRGGSTVVRDLTGAGTPEADWQAKLGLLPSQAAAALAPPGAQVLLIAPHPDDEVFGAGATAAQLAALGHEVSLVAVTDGEASHPGQRSRLHSLRPAESRRALRLLGLHGPVHRLRLPDGAVDPEELAPLLAPLVRAAEVVLAPWEHDGHPDHDVTGAVAGRLAAAYGRPMLAYLVWAWHWASPGGADLPWAAAIKVPTPAAVLAAKRHAASAFCSQLEGPDPILPAHVLARLIRPFEVLLAGPR